MTTTSDPSATPPRFATDAFQDALDELLAAARWGAADPEAIHATAELVEEGDADSWLCEWTALAGRTWAAAAEAPRGGDAALYLRAASYYDAALALIAHTDGSVAELDLWRRQRTCWDRAAARLGGERLAIPYAGTTLPGHLFRAPGSAARAPRPLVVIDHGGDGPTSRAYARGGAAAAARGYHWMTFDGPGRQAALIEQGLVLRPDWEAVLTPVADAMTARPDADPARLAVIGLGHAGYGVPRALAFEHRFAAAVADPGVVDVSTQWTDRLPDAAARSLREGARTAFDREIHLAGLFEPETRTRLERLGRPYGAAGASPYDLFRRVRDFRLGDEAERIGTPLLVCEHAGERSWPDQARRLCERLPGTAQLELVPARTPTDGAVLDWLDARLR